MDKDISCVELPNPFARVAEEFYDPDCDAVPSEVASRLTSALEELLEPLSPQLLEDLRERRILLGCWADMAGEYGSLELERALQDTMVTLSSAIRALELVLGE